MTLQTTNDTSARRKSGATIIRIDFTHAVCTDESRAYEAAVRRNLDRAMWRAQDRASAIDVAPPQCARDDAPSTRLSAPRRRTAPVADDDAHAIGGAE